MFTSKQILGNISGGRVLDVATGSGGFIHFLLEGLKDHAEIIGLDSSDRGATAFAETFKDKPGIRFEKMDALHLDFPDVSFDTVCISNSLHHFDSPLPVLREMERVLRPGGYLIIAEMYRDGQTETQMTHVLLHHWWAAVDRTAGVIHNETYPREQLVEMASGLGLKNLALYDLSETNDDPKGPEILAEIGPVIERYIQRAIGYPDLQLHGAELRRRVQEVGFHSAASLIAVGMKP